MSITDTAGGESTIQSRVAAANRTAIAELSAIAGYARTATTVDQIHEMIRGRISALLHSNLGSTA